MARRKQAPKREVSPDPKYGNVLVSRFINVLMKEGKKSTAERILYDSLDLVEEKTGQPSVELMKKAINNVKPAVEVKSRRVGGATYQVPVEIRPERRLALALRWLKSFASARPEKTMAERLAGELMAAANGEGAAVKKREDTHRMADANKAFAHYSW
jgi:small subunit ribosomal protein S7